MHYKCSASLLRIKKIMTNYILEVDKVFIVKTVEMLALKYET